eukprot:CAMPEP_0185028482 /NCGR_PEP_ID=MMETSP1103-20130426/14225_1 /TAXON_ID=36769 /ORGANISM="Paraphysomonas bandaiensis, Strain Caron Lab Isolate" /LENGTH=899 /DNA_ID=CAMNT_0027562909 /DNA_START=19 /DNA_END=2715 /DNA_ORIENTATION=-
MSTLKILALHGKQQTAEVLRTRLGRLPHKARAVAKFTIVDAPHLLELKTGDEVPLRTWFYRDGNQIVEESLQQSLQYLEGVWRSEGPFEGIFGFSMGGTMTAMLCTMPERFPGIKFVIIGGAPDAPAYLLDASGNSKVPTNVRSLHLMGQKDNVIPVANSALLASRFVSPEVIEHEQGHCIPTRAVMLNSYVAFLEKMQHEISSMASDTPVTTHVTPPLSEVPDVKRKGVVSDECANLQAEEMDVLGSIYSPEEFEVHTSPASKGDPTASCRVLLSPGYSSAPPPKGWAGNLGVNITLAENYPIEPNHPPHIEIYTGSLSMLEFTVAMRRSLHSSIVRVAAEICSNGETCVLQCVQAGNEWLSEGMWQHTSALSTPSTEESSPDVGNMPECSVQGEVSDEQEDEWIRNASSEAGRIAAQNRVNASNYTEKWMESEGLNASASARGLWNYTVGLIGKPSAGKSTFYNAVIRASLDSRGHRHMAEVAAHPFTTIEPNIGPGWYASHMEDGDDNIGDILPGHREPFHGRCTEGRMAGRRLLPIVVKDVAGLVPGAYKGRGKGNRFLSDLCDADVLVHVLDITGRSDKDGNIIEQDGDYSTSDVDTATLDTSMLSFHTSSPLADAEWIRFELHRWIYNNIKAKWESVGRRGDSKCSKRVLALFSGYKGPLWTVELAAQRAGLSLDHAINWPDRDIHRLVAHYICIRFPICLALNKVDSLSPEKGRCVVEACQKLSAERGEAAVPVSAQSECWALEKISGRNLPPVNSKKWVEEEERLRTCMSTWGGSGVMEAISTAVSLKPPVLCFPVSDLDTELPVAWTSSAKIPACQLRDCLQLKQGSTVEDVFDALKRGALPHCTMHGDFVRAEGRGIDRNSKKKLLARDTVIDQTNCVIRIQTNRKSVW